MMFSKKSIKIIKFLRAGELVTNKEAQYLLIELDKHLKATSEAMYVTHTREETERRQKITGEVVDLLEARHFAEINKSLIKQFDQIVIEHIKGLSPNYYKEMRGYDGSGSFAPRTPDMEYLFQDLGQLLEPDVLCERYRSEVNSTVNDYLFGEGWETVGDIAGLPVYFNEHKGVYVYGKSPKVPGVIELWLTGVYTPPRW